MTDIHRHVKYLTFHAADQFALSVRIQPIVQPRNTPFWDWEWLSRRVHRGHRPIKHLAAEALKEETRASPNTRGSKISTSGISVLIMFIFCYPFIYQDFCYHASHTLTPVRESHPKCLLEFFIRQARVERTLRRRRIGRRRNALHFLNRQLGTVRSRHLNT